MKTIQTIFKWLTLTFFGITLFSLTIGQILPIEFADWKDMHLFYDIIFQGLPIAILLTMIWTIKNGSPKRKKITIGILTPIIAFAAFFGTIFLMFSFGFGAWVNQEIVYENKTNPQETINEQIWDIGAFGYGGQRTVKLSPTLGLWNIVTEIDTTEIEKDNWTLVQREEDIKFP